MRVVSWAITEVVVNAGTSAFATMTATVAARRVEKKRRITWRKWLEEGNAPRRKVPVVAADRQCYETGYRRKLTGLKATGGG